MVYNMRVYFKVLSIMLITIFTSMAYGSNHQHISNNDALKSLSFDITYSGDVSAVLEQIKTYDTSLIILRPLGKVHKVLVNLNLQGIGIDDLSNALKDQTNGQVGLVYDTVMNSARINYTDKFDVGNDAVSESLKWQNGDTPKPILKGDGVVRFPYGEYQPTVICQPLNLCDIELQAGEEIEGVVIGDSVRWNEGDKGIPIVYSGVGNKLTPHLVLKASQDSLETTLLVTTSKRTYMIRLKSRNNGYVARSGFYYPDDLIKEFNINKDKLKDQIATNNMVIATNPDIKMPLIDLSHVNYAYSIKGDDYVWKPTHVFDDGVSVYIQMPDNVSARSLPGLCVLPDGIDDKNKCEMVNFRYNNHFYIVDKLFNEAVLMNGFDNTKETIDIIRNSERAGFWARLFGSGK